MSRAKRRRPRTSKTYNRKLAKLKKWHTARVEARKSWSKERLEKAKELKPLEWYVSQLRQPGQQQETKSTPSINRKALSSGWWGR